MRSIVWFRRDLRLHDNRAFVAAAAASDQILAVFFATPHQWQVHNDAPAKIAFWQAHLQSLKLELEKINVPLLAVECRDFADVPALLCRIAQTNNCSKVFFNSEYEVNEKRRDEACITALKKCCVEASACHDRLLIEPDRVLTGAGKPYSVFTPFRNNWAKQIFKHDIEVQAIPPGLQPFKPVPVVDGLNQYSFELSRENSAADFASSLWPVGEKAAHERLNQFAESAMSEYDQKRDLPSVDGTSRLSPYLAAGVLSARQCLAAILKSTGKNDALPDFGNGAGTWLNELIWRDFYTHVMVAFPRVSKGMPFQLSTERIKWRKDAAQLQAWKDGKTGYPIVDAAMRQLKHTGWMHNRLRMVAAMFLSKHLLLDWREGERWFMQNLLDGDLAANNGGWQWSASTGTDAAPYFRVFNPFSQSKRFDSAGAFIRQFCPELSKVSAKALHDAELLAKEIAVLKIDYPGPVVDHAMARARAIAAFK